MYDEEMVYRELLADEPTAFWLDGGLVATGRASVLGTSTGPGAEVIVRDVADGDAFAELQGGAGGPADGPWTTYRLR